jgi:hypothetical protein
VAGQNHRFGRRIAGQVLECLLRPLRQEAEVANGSHRNTQQVRKHAILSGRGLD